MAGPAVESSALRNAYQSAAEILRSEAPEEAGRIFSALLKERPDEPIFLHGLGLSLALSGNTEKALHAFRKATSCAPSFWKAWQSIAEISPSEDERIGALAALRDALADAASKRDAPHPVGLRYANLLIDRGEYETALQVLSGLIRTTDVAASAQMLIARAHYRRAEFEIAFRYYCKTFHAATPAPSAATDGYGFDARRAAIAAQDMIGLLNTSGTRPFLAAGTLLGFVRSGAPLKHDRDVDIGVLCDGSARPDIAGIIRRHPCLQLGFDARPGDRYFSTAYQGIGIDIFLYEASGGHLLSGFSDLPGDIQWRHSGFQLKTATYEGAVFPIPENTNEHLAETYGADWQRPDPGFCSAVSSPALHRVAPYARASYAALRALRAKLEGQLDKAGAIEGQSPFPFINTGEAS